MTTFRKVGTGIMVECEVCGARGFDGGRWQRKCIEGHPYPCPECGRRFTTKAGRSNHRRMSKNHQGPAQQTLDLPEPRTADP